MRLWPRRLAPRVALILLMALIVSQAISAVLYGWERTEAAKHVFEQSRTRIVAAVKMLENYRGSARRDVLAVINSPTLGIRLSPQPVRGEDDDDDDGDGDDVEDGGIGPRGVWLNREVRKRIPALRGRPMVIAFVEEEAWFRPPRRRHRDGAMPNPLPSRRMIALSVKLRDGKWAVFTTPVDLVSPTWGIRMSVWLILVAGTVTIVAVWISRRVTKPIVQFARAADRLGVDPSAPPLPEEGSEEILTAARAFNTMQGRLRRLIDDRTRILAAISHDLRTSLTRMRLRAEFIGDAEQKEKAAADLDDMQTMLDSFLAFARDEADGETHTPVDVASLTQSLCNDLSDAGQTVAYDGPDHAVLSCRHVSLRRALANLIDNAVTYGGQADVTVVETSAGVTFDIADRGPGVPAESREAVFDPFFRLEGSRSRETGGTGLGLTLARAIARRHGGDLTLHDRPGGGLIGRLFLPKQA